ncbi:hypothetical protein SARC_01109 [Sphaeroforma arctica JP610]|uniref:Fe2OG dioxygenase domain-containing protein n=1 Tax=Sphaeroforma arctica JP610 TaxID=667725 RepID=A0A0L0GD10_9EUKA|nr:hypothetical protein SARC_01109 [Sphaeroforma arctica JP610]KNC86776.1 hypothetical protein SARC_01109 [Sphaeroforma arctica JP610]|eukprot:XP_014160678.1 hypothetical protein SARC_01109 [Sphaeroforma arctica JP610]
MDLFFKTPESVRNAIRRRRDNFRGYFDDEFTKKKIDHKRCFDFGPENTTTDVCSDFDQENQWPDQEMVPHFKSTMKEYYAEMRRVSLIIIDALVSAMGMDTADFREAVGVDTDSSFLRLNYYPLAPTDHTIGVHEHNDAGLVTLLYQDQVGGLQVRLNDEWAEIPPIADALVLNIGDMMQIFTNGRVKAPLHRVVASNTSDRFSAPYFFNPSYTSECRPLKQMFREGETDKYAPINWVHFRRRRVLGDMIIEVEPEVQVTDYETA